MTKKPQDAVELLDADHRSAQVLFDEFRLLSQHHAGCGKRKALAEQVCMELAIHMRLEEEIFYPPLRAALRDDDLLDDAEAEHAGAKELIAQVLSTQPADPLYDAKVTVLGQYFAHHVAQEREQMFPRVRRSGLDLALLGEQLRVRKQELRAVPEALREDALASVSA